MKMISKKKSLIILALIVILSIVLCSLRVRSQYINSTLGLILFGLLVYEMVSEMGENYEDKKEDEYVLSLVDSLKDVHPAVREVLPKLKFFEGRRSYTINKTYVHICKVDEHGQLYDRNMLTHVILHEIAHAICPEIGHTDRFHAIFEELKEAAICKKLFDPNKPLVQNYCQY
jgi:hypothetical protein